MTPNEREKFTQLRITKRHLEQQLDAAKRARRHDEITPIASELRQVKAEISRLLDPS